MPLLLGALLLTMSALLLPNESLAQPRPDGIGVGMGFDVEYIAPQPFRDPGGKTSAWFPVKYVCGETQPGDRLVPGPGRRRRGQPRPRAHAAWGGSRGVHHHG
jgi:hypothetical protein